jgi:anti-sigma factor RsiW
MSQCMSRDQRLRELIGIDLPSDELERLARVDALLRMTRRPRSREARPLLPHPGSETAPGESTHTQGASRECEPSRVWISAALDGEVSEFESIRMREHVEHCPYCETFKAYAERLATALRTAAQTLLKDEED